MVRLLLDEYGMGKGKRMHHIVKYWWAGLICLIGMVFYLPSDGMEESDGFEGKWKCYYAYVEPGAVREGIEEASYVQLPYELPGSEAFRAGEGPALLGRKANSVQYTVRISDDFHYQSPMLFFVTYNEAVKVFCDGRLIYSFGDFVERERVYGTRWHMVIMPEDCPGRQLAIQLFSEHKEALGNISHVSLNSHMMQAKKMFFHDAAGIVLMTITLIVIVLLLLVDSGQRKLESICLLLYMTVWLCGTAAGGWLGLLLLDKPVFWHYVFYVALFLQPFPLGFLIYKILDGVGHYLAWLFLAGNVVFMLAALVGTGWGYDSFTQLAHEQSVWAVYGTLVATLLLFLQASKGDIALRNLSLVIFAVFCLEVMDKMWNGFLMLPFPGAASNLSILPIIVYVLWIIRHTIAEKWQLNQEKAELEHKVKKERYKAQIDPLTRCFTRRKLENALQFAVNSSEYLGIPVALLMVDIDKFKSINDTYGHAVGDKVLQGVADVMRRHTGFSHTLARYGGEEFMIVCLMHGMDRAKELAERIRRDVEKAVLIEDRQVTCSIGISCWHIKSGDTPDALQKRADDALYYAKNNGRNRCVAENEIE